MKKIRYITDAAMITALVVAILFLSELLGLELEESLFFLLPAPIALYALLHSPTKAFIPALSIALLALLIHDPIHGLLFVVPSCFVGVLYGFFVNKKYPDIVRIGIAIVGAAIINVLTSVVFSQILFGISIIEDTQALVAGFVNFLSPLGMTSAMEAFFEAVVIGLIPAFIGVISIFEGVLTHIATIFLANRVAKNNTLGVFRGLRIYLPRMVSGVLLPVMVVSVVYLSDLLTLSGALKILLVIGINISFAAAIFYVFEGLALTALYARKLKKPGLYILAVLVSVLVFPLMSALGIVDSLLRLQGRLLGRA